MSHALKPVSKQSLPDRLARQIRVLIQQGEYRQGDKLPPIIEMARRFGVGHPTVREALKSLETIGLVSIRHGSGGYVYRLVRVSGVRKHETIAPLTRLGGYVCGTPSTITSRSFADRMSHTRGTRTARESAKTSWSYEWSRRFRNP